MERQLLLITVAAVTIGTAAGATLVSIRGRSPAAQLAAKRLARVALLGWPKFSCVPVRMAYPAASVLQSRIVRLMLMMSSCAGAQNAIHADVL